ncbi:hypothetical protein HPB50_003311 [Hyalomma asiaticum]|uniref:Uncharacterized protein n=1 Tax=Hyalomma asiaticum TaxID=266040 RepID=A0ACB7SDL5_HYAAI|nr:hypothetical protein HPB50_003311 [Hyalomma asiaticum]
MLSTHIQRSKRAKSCATGHRAARLGPSRWSMVLEPKGRWFKPSVFDGGGSEPKAVKFSAALLSALSLADLLADGATTLFLKTSSSSLCRQDDLERYFGKRLQSRQQR